MVVVTGGTAGGATGNCGCSPPAGNGRMIDWRSKLPGTSVMINKINANYLMTFTVN